MRTYALATCTNGKFKAYFYREGYIRTSCRPFKLENLRDTLVHLTNDAVQKKAQNYGEQEPANKLSYAEFQDYLDINYEDLNISMERDIVPQFKAITTDCFLATFKNLNPSRLLNTFEIFGLDFMLDDTFKVSLIEVNTNPCLELCCPLLKRLIPAMIDNSLLLAVDPLYPPPSNFGYGNSREITPMNKYELILDEDL